MPKNTKKDSLVIGHIGQAEKYCEEELLEK